MHNWARAAKNKIIVAAYLQRFLDYGVANKVLLNG